MFSWPQPVRSALLSICHSHLPSIILRYILLAVDAVSQNNLVSGLSEVEKRACAALYKLVTPVQFYSFVASLKCGTLTDPDVVIVLWTWTALLSASWLACE